MYELLAELQAKAKTAADEVENLEMEWIQLINDRKLGALKQFLRQYLHLAYRHYFPDESVKNKDEEIRDHDAWMAKVEGCRLIPPIAVLYVAPNKIEVRGHDVLAADHKLYDCYWKTTWIWEGGMWQCLEVDERSVREVNPPSLHNRIDIQKVLDEYVDLRLAGYDVNSGVVG
jgi:hypothetical protein